MADKVESAESKTEMYCCKCTLEYVSVACNRTPLCVDWGRNGWVAYGACYSVALCRPKVGWFHVRNQVFLPTLLVSIIFDLS